MTQATPPFRYRLRKYLHFDSTITEREAEALATDPAAVARHPFLPFITRDQKTQKIRRKATGGVEKKPAKIRQLVTTAHKDAHIYTHYSSILSGRYEAVLAERNLGSVITAFRPLNGRKYTFFANEAFEAIKTFGTCAVLCLDASDYFGSILHSRLKTTWCSILPTQRLPDDHYAVYRALTEACSVEHKALCRILGIHPRHPRKTHPKRFCNAKGFRTKVRGNGLCHVNRSGVGIPQGTPIGAVLSNLYFLDFDTEINALVTGMNGFYRRYCDDILVIVPTVEQRGQVHAKILALLSDLGLRVNPAKIQLTEFRWDAAQLTSSKVFSYLGLTFDGVHKRIRPSLMAKYYRKMRLDILKAKLIAQRAGKECLSPGQKRRLQVQYTYLGRHNFINDAFEMAKIMNDPGIKKQVKPHWKRFNQLVAKPL